MAAAAALQQALTADLALLGGVPLTVTSSKSPLTWSARSVSTEAEWGRDAKKDGRQLTGQVFASVEVSIRLRDFDRLGAVTQALARHEDFNLSRAHWQADDDNSGWPGVRAAAIEAAVRKGRDYAASLWRGADGGRPRRRRRPARRRPARRRPARWRWGTGPLGHGWRPPERGAPPVTTAPHGPRSLVPRRRRTFLGRRNGRGLREAGAGSRKSQDSLGQLCSQPLYRVIPGPYRGLTCLGSPLTWHGGRISIAPTGTGLCPV